ncbi:cilia- and flagella-associated protein 100-like [Gigantopelta aegis]|uniref:cilia- and flagella-associated protein 100-like n=1 Tax=Gigantopelta aegis TaxID=1735272 RepID=UPI001B88D81D|nr:cilia- and flagella-associated protein 100-like [Gigantopelta aegis]XP_041347545.1 cilia- and flagella-associated protein 100-like [Gigantopelta aegis]XP_041347547.1 cilia- and flagella-associated protein 100-like [Gigantopelta aegis]
MGDSPIQRSIAESPDSDISQGKRHEVGSRLSGKVTFPNSVKSASSDHSSVKQDAAHSGNPFVMPHDSDIFMLRDKERKKKKLERERQRQLKVHEKTTYATQVNCRTAQMIRPADSDEDEEEEETDKAVAVKDDPQFTIAVTRDRHVEKESLAEYISKKREMFLVQYSLGVKRDEMRKLEEIAQAEERKLELAEQYLEEDAAMFDEFLKENDKNSVEAIKIAEQETKMKLEKVAEIKRINAQMMAIKSEINKYEDTLKEYQLYKKFLDALTPQEYRAEKDELKRKRREERRKEREKNLINQKKSSASDGSDKPGSKGRKLSKKQSAKSKVISLTEDGLSSSTECSDDDSDEDVDLYFTDPQELLNIFAELEEQNLSLIQNSQETEEALEDMKQNIKQTKMKMEKETQILREQIDKLKKAIAREEEKAADLQIKAKMFNYGEFKAEDQDKMLNALNKKVEEVYRSCIGDNEANINTLQMLTNIENRLEELFEQIETMPQDKVEAAERAKEKERRLKMREEKLELQRIHQEERVRRALERAKADPKKKTGKKLVFRSQPPMLKKKQDDGADQASKEEEELAYFFQW